MALKKITGKDIKEAVDWLWEHKQDGGCVHQVLETTNDGTKLCFVVGWSKGADYGDDEKEYGYFDDGYCISAKIGYQHRNNAMQTDYDWDFNMPYDLETGDVWDTSSYVPRDADWEREAADYNKEAEKIWAAYGDPDGKNWWDDDADDKAPLDLMESKKKESLNTKAESEDATSFEVKDDGIYVNGECITLNVDDWYADKRETKTLSDVIPEMVGSRKVFVIDPQYDYYIVKTLYTGKDIKPVKKVKVYKDFELYDTADVVSACVGDYVRDIGPVVSESKKHTCSMQKKKESLTKVQEMHPMFKNWNPRNQAQVNNTLRLAMAECPQDMPELIKIVKAKGFDVPSGLTPATGWGSFESRSKRQYKECSMQKKKESLSKKNEDASAGWDVDFFDFYAGRYLGMKALTFALNDAEDLIRELKTSARGVSTGAKTWKELGVWIKEHIVQPFDDISEFLNDFGSAMDEE